MNEDIETSSAYPYLALLSFQQHGRDMPATSCCITYYQVSPSSPGYHGSGVGHFPAEAFDCWCKVLQHFLPSLSSQEVLLLQMVK